MFTREYSLQTGFAKGFDMRSILWPGSSVEREESLEPVFVRNAVFKFVQYSFWREGGIRSD